jgi:hypothetical protein
MSSVIQAEFKAWSAVIAVVGGLLLAGLGFFSGCHVQKKHDAAKYALVEKQRDDSYASLNASAAALRQVNAEAANAIAKAKANEADALQAGKVATLAEQAAKQQVVAADKRYAKAIEKPGCVSLMTSNLGAVCALSSH